METKRADVGYLLAFDFRAVYFFLLFIFNVTTIEIMVTTIETTVFYITNFRLNSAKKI